MNCYVLTGGRSTRMGRSKAELFLGRVVAAAQPVFERVIAVERAGGPRHMDDIIFEPEHPHAAPIFGVQRALQDAPGRCFVIATDFALITTDVLRFLRERFERSNASMLVPVWSGVPQVLCAGYALCVLPDVDRRVAARTFDVLGLLEEVDVELLDESEIRARFSGEPLLNVNTPEDVALMETKR